MNLQKPEARADGDGSTLDVHSMFFTIQGEGPFAGHRALFIRLAGCNLQCPGCDTEYTNNRGIATIAQIKNAVKMQLSENKAPYALIVITGGEPLRQPIGRLVDQLTASGSRVQIESNGVFPVDSTLEYLLEIGKATLVLSPKTSQINALTASLACAYKYVLDADSVHPSDGLPFLALGHKASRGVARPHDRTKPIYLSPYDSGDEAHNARNLQAVVKSARQYGYIAGVQLHKLMNLE